jgi:hypothetical protein
MTKHDIAVAAKNEGGFTSWMARALRIHAKAVSFLTLDGFFAIQSERPAM